MKKYLILAVIALTSMAANAQIGSTTSRSIQTSTTEVTRTEKIDEKSYISRIQFGYNGVRYAWSFSNTDKSSFGHGATLGYLANIKVARKVPLYVYTGVIGTCDFAPDGGKEIPNWAHASAEVPFGATYRVRFGTSKVYFSPFFGFHVKVNALWKDDDDHSLFDDKYYKGGGNRCQFGSQLGFNFDLNKFYWGFQLDNEFNKAYHLGKSDTDCNTMGVRFNLGFVF